MQGPREMPKLSGGTVGLVIQPQGEFVRKGPTCASELYLFILTPRYLPWAVHGCQPDISADVSISHAGRAASQLCLKRHFRLFEWG